MTELSEDLAKSRKTIDAYEDYAERYDALVRHVPNQREQKWLKRLVKLPANLRKLLKDQYRETTEIRTGNE